MEDNKTFFLKVFILAGFSLFIKLSTNESLIFSAIAASICYLVAYAISSVIEKKIASTRKAREEAINLKYLRKHNKTRE